MPSAESRDFPFYAARPRMLTFASGALVLLGCGAGFAALLAAPGLVDGMAGRWVGAALFVLLPLLALGMAAGRDWTSLFHRPTARDVAIGFAFAPLCFLASAIPALLLLKGGLTSANPAFAMLGALEDGQRLSFFGAAAVQLLGEELFTILPFLVLLAWAGQVMPRRRAILLAWVSTALMFGAIHLPTYDWRLEQSLLVIGTARMVLTGAYLLTKNVWASFIAHLTNDWTLFLGAMLLAARA